MPSASESAATRDAIGVARSARTASLMSFMTRDLFQAGDERGRSSEEAESACEIDPRERGHHRAEHRENQPNQPCLPIRIEIVVAISASLSMPLL